MPNKVLPLTLLYAQSDGQCNYTVHDFGYDRNAKRCIGLPYSGGVN